ncbi:nuclear transport factor 2 family protein [Permianibacter aggregans]|uniref:SnoaL-like protein n=1 Tax=Permianibacter aggregans TaxID=1510150 RepID=A0A4R6UQ67_9GAMM|nr:nuclear transport factor 2 family protein [Permianibacter aggregans]QGX39154.1 nuclear transport factor 2 family protein [Permianibacter aggregans]TDQ47633.1 hypothetical protein EV696_10936 [Permianibacter aggregans]
MKYWGLIFGLLLPFASFAESAEALSTAAISARIQLVNDAQNNMMLSGSTVADVDALFAFFSNDFVYVHEVYGGTYPREHLYHNSINNLQAGRYKLTEPRYQILQILPGLNAAAVQRREQRSGKIHLTLFEFKDDKISKIVEYWQ